MVLRAVQASANQGNTSASLTWDSINRMCQQYGAPNIDFDRFSDRFDSDPTIQAYVDNFDESGIVLKTHEGEKQQGLPQGPQGSPAPNAMQKAATDATNTAMKQA